MSYTIMDGVNDLANGRNLSLEKMEAVMRAIMSGEVSDIKISSFLTAAKMHGETPEMILAAAKIMREFASNIRPTVKRGRIIDTCGTGGDNAHTFNISTLTAIISAAAGVTVAKHGNRSVSSKCGSADILEAFGVNLGLKPEEVEAMISKIGIGFMFAPGFHSAMKYVMPVRKDLAMRTIFNILGPLTNPANATGGILGVFDESLILPMAEVLRGLGAEHAYVIHSDPGLDELIPISNMHIAEIKDGKITQKTISAADIGFSCSIEDLKASSLEENMNIVKSILTGEDRGNKREVVLLNASYAIFSSGIVTSLDEAKQKAAEAIDNGAAVAKLKEMVVESKGDLSKFESIF